MSVKYLKKVFNRWVEAVPSKDQSAATVIKFLTREVIPNLGMTSLVRNLITVAALWSFDGTAFTHLLNTVFFFLIFRTQLAGCQPLFASIAKKNLVF